MTAHTFRRRANALPENVSGKEGIEHKVRIVPVPFCAMRYIIVSRHLPGDNAL